MATKVVAVILSFNRRADILACLESLGKNTYNPLSTIVLDIGSQDGSVEAIRAQFPEVMLVQLAENLGYAGNNNIGLRLALEQAADWVLVLNDDITLANDCVERLVEIGESNPAIGMVGPLVYHADEINVIQSAGGTLDKFWVTSHLGQNDTDTGQFSQPQAVDWLSGSALLVKQLVIEKVGDLDERFFMYWEEVDWCLRAREQGFDLYLAPQAKIWHKGVQRHYQPKPAITYYDVRNRFLILAKHKAPWFVRFKVWTQTLQTLLSWSFRPKWRNMHSHRDALWQAINDYLQQRWGIWSNQSQ